MSELFDREAARLEGYNAGKRDAVELVIERIRTEISALNIAGLWHYVIADHQLDEIANSILEE